MSLVNIKELRTPYGKDPGDTGDCENPRSLTIHLHEDRWGNHIICLERSGKVVHCGAVPHRGGKENPSRAPFSASALELHRLLREVEEGDIMDDLLEEGRNVPE